MEAGRAAVLLRWFATHWCNLRCPYCRQNHARRQPIDGHGAHCFDNWPVDRWLRAFQRHFQARRLSLVITGGKPLVDRAPMAKLVNELTAMPTVECIWIDTRILKEEKRTGIFSSDRHLSREATTGTSHGRESVGPATPCRP